MQQERLSAFREMAGEVAHDFTDTLSSILARAQILAADAQDQEVVQSVRMIERVALEGTRIVRRLQDFSRTRPARPFQAVDLNQLVSEQQNMLAAQKLQSASSMVGRTIAYQSPDGITATGVVTSATLTGSEPTLKVGNKDVPLSSVTQVRSAAG